MNGLENDDVKEYEIKHRALARRAAAQGMVLLKNDGDLLPLREGSRVALFGAGAACTIKGGSGSGDVNSRETVSFAEGLGSSGFIVTNKDWVAEYRSIFEKARCDWRDTIWKKMDEKGNDGMAFFDAYSTTPFYYPAGGKVTGSEADTAVYCLTRTAGEGIDRSAVPGDYYLTEEESAQLDDVCSLYKDVVLVLNVGGVVDLSFLDRHSNIRAVIMASQPGMEAGGALADVLLGKVNPSAKLTDSWAFRYEDYPNSATFSHNNGNVDQEIYAEDIYVGYRYFDTFEVPVRYGFGFGLSYTRFRIDWQSSEIVAVPGGKAVRTCVKVINGGKRAGREVVQIYGSAPQGNLSKEARRLVDFRKTSLLQPGESEIMYFETPVDRFASYDEKKPGWVLETGIYTLFVGNSLQEAEPVANFAVMQDILLVKTKNICAPEEELALLKADADKVAKRRSDWAQQCKLFGSLSPDDVQTKYIHYNDGTSLIPADAMDIAKTLDTEVLIKLCTGDIAKGQEVALGSAGIRVPGSAAETSDAASDHGVGSLVLADGPAGLRLTRSFEVRDGQIIGTSIAENMEGGFLCREKKEITGEVRYQNCTAFPVGTLLAQSWDPELIAEFGQAVGEEMQLFDVQVWLAPGMCIHRNPLCGRNFEYYSEDPLLTGICAAAVTKGTQSVKNCAVTIKHFACNNQEDNRMNSDSILSERCLREIYLKGFEIAIKLAQPGWIMTSYNKINGIHAANNFGTCTEAARSEWGFRGAIMTDWTTTVGSKDGCTAAGCLRAGNDAVMPGCPADHDNIRSELKAGTLSRDELIRSAARVIASTLSLTK